MQKTHTYSRPERTAAQPPQAPHLYIDALQAVLADRLWRVFWPSDVGRSGTRASASVSGRLWDGAIRLCHV